MKIDGANQYKKQTYVKEAGKLDSNKVASKKKETKSNDTVSLSKDLKDLQFVKKAVDNASDVRHEKVSELKQQIKSGTYQINADKIADKMINSADNSI